MNGNEFKAFTDMKHKAEVLSAMLLWEKVLRARLRVQRFIYNRKAGPEANKNYKAWSRLPDFLRSTDMEDYFMWLADLWARWENRPTAVPSVNMLGSSKWHDKYLRDLPRRMRGRKEADLDTSQITMGTDILRALLAGCPDVATRRAQFATVIRVAWSAFPPIWLAVCMAFWEDVRLGLTDTSLARDHYERAVKAYWDLSGSRALAEAGAAYTREVLDALHNG